MRTMTVSCFVLAAMPACSGGDSSGNQPTDPGNTPGREQGENGGQPTENLDLANLMYSDIRTVHDDPIPANMFPSQLDETQLLPACKEGQVFEFDICWDSIVIDVDQKSIQFFSDSGMASTKIEIGKPVPSEFNRAIFQNEGHLSKKFSHHHYDSSTTTQVTNEVAPNLVKIETGSTLMTALGFGSVGQPPWATSPVFFTTSTDDTRSMENEVLASIAVKTTFTYGLVETSPGRTVAHNWHYKGAIRFNGKTYTLPVRLTDIEPDVHNFKTGACNFLLENADGTAQLCETVHTNWVRKQFANGNLKLDYIVDEIVLGMDVTEVEEQQRLREEAERGNNEEEPWES